MRKANSSDKKLVVDILMSAFLDIQTGNSLNYFIKGKLNRTSRIKILFGYLFEKSLIKGDIYISDNELGCILLDRYPNTKFSFNLLMSKMRTVLTAVGVIHIPRIIKRQHLLDQFHAEKSYIYPTAMAAHSSVSGKGTCVRMIRELLSSYNGEAITIYTETTTKENLDIYKKFGFEIIGESKELGFTMYFLKLILGQ